MKHADPNILAAALLVLTVACEPPACHRREPMCTGGCCMVRGVEPDLDWVGDEWAVTETANCTIRSRNPQLNALLATHAEAALERITEQITDGDDLPGPVRIIVHPTPLEYVAAAVADATMATTTARTEIERGGDGTVTALVVHLTQLTADGGFDTRLPERILPHELCHVVLTAAFADRPAPLYLQEGLATLCEQDDHAAAMIEAGLAIEQGKAMPLGDLLAATECPAGAERLFCALSYSFVAYLRDQMSDRQFGAFVAELKAGHNTIDALHRALRIAHNERTAARLQQAWEDDALRRAALVAALAESAK